MDCKTSGVFMPRRLPPSAGKVMVKRFTKLQTFIARPN